MEPDYRLRSSVPNESVAGFSDRASAEIESGRRCTHERARPGAALCDVSQERRESNSLGGGGRRSQGDGLVCPSSRGLRGTAGMESVCFRRALIQECEFAGGLRRSQGKTQRASKARKAMSEHYFEFR